MNIRTWSTSTVTVIVALQSAGLALGFQSVLPADVLVPAAACTPAVELPVGHDNLVDINSAPVDWLVWVGIDESLAGKIISSRPYRSTGDLLARGILPPVTYDRIKDRIIARHV